MQQLIQLVWPYGKDIRGLSIISPGTTHSELRNYTGQAFASVSDIIATPEVYLNYII